jgi:fructose-bisphosphate aldolase class II
MPLISSKQLLLNALENKYAVGAFNINNLEMAKAVIEAATEENAPVIIQVSQGAINYAGISVLSKMIKALAESTHIPVVMHFDHGKTVDQNIICLANGFTSLMFDGSSLTFNENVIQSKRISKIAHPCGIPVEAELGKVPLHGVIEAELQEMLTNPAQARTFIRETNVDSLAVAVGSVHSQCANQSVLDIERLKEINREIPEIPLVLHGSSGVMEESVRKGILNGICKVNVGTCLIQSFSEAVKQYIEKNPDVIDPRKYLEAGKLAMKEEVRKKIRLCGSNQTIK